MTPPNDPATSRAYAVRLVAVAVVSFVVGTAVGYAVSGPDWTMVVVFVVLAALIAMPLWRV